jgi:hypothetical protein
MHLRLQVAPSASLDLIRLILEYNYVEGDGIKTLRGYFPILLRRFRARQKSENPMTEFVKPRNARAKLYDLSYAATYRY